MSLINDMLRNLEAQRPDDLARHDLQREIRALPKAKTRRGGKAVLWLLVLAALAGAMAWQWPVLMDVLVPPPPPAPPVAAVTPAPAVAETPPPVPPTVNPENDENSQYLRLSSSLSSAPLAPVAVPDPVVAPAAPSPKVATEPLPAKEVEKPAAEPPKPAPPPGPVKIEKSPVLATPRDRADAELRKAENALAGGQRGEALEHLRAALRIDPAYALPRQALLRQLLEQRKFDEAMSVLQEGLEQQPAQVAWAMSLARLQLEQGDLVAADRTLTRSQPFAEANADYAGFVGHVKTRLGNHKQAAASYQRATRVSPGEGRWWLGLGLALEADGKTAEAKDALKRALAAGNLSADLSSIAEQHLR